MAGRLPPIPSVAPPAPAQQMRGRIAKGRASEARRESLTHGRVEDGAERGGGRQGVPCPARGAFSHLLLKAYKQRQIASEMAGTADLLLRGLGPLETGWRMAVETVRERCARARARELGGKLKFHHEYVSLSAQLGGRAACSSGGAADGRAARAPDDLSKLTRSGVLQKAGAEVHELSMAEGGRGRGDGRAAGEPAVGRARAARTTCCEPLHELQPIERHLRTLLHHMGMTNPVAHELPPPSARRAGDAGDAGVGGAQRGGRRADGRAAGAITPMDGAITPVDGAITPVDGAITPVDGAITPMDGAITPMDGAITLIDGSHRLIIPQQSHHARAMADSGPPGWRRRSGHTRPTSSRQRYDGRRRAGGDGGGAWRRRVAGGGRGASRGADHEHRRLGRGGGGERGRRRRRASPTAARARCAASAAGAALEATIDAAERSCAS